MGTIVGLLFLAGFFWLLFGSSIKASREAARKREHENKIKRLQSLRQNYPDVFKAWYGNETYFYNMSDYELDSRLSKSIYEWQSKQREIDNQRERERLERERRLEEERKERERLEQRRKQANEICQKYPNAIKKHLGVSSVYSQESVEKVLSFSVSDLQLEEAALLEEIRRRQTEIENKFKAIEAKYPKGVALVKKLRSERKRIEGIYTPVEFGSLESGSSVINTPERLIRLPETVFHVYDTISIESSHMESWSKSQNDFASKIPSLCKSTLPNNGYYSYVVSIDGVDETGEKKLYPFKVWQTFNTSFCLSESIDYSNHKNWQERANQNKEFLSQERFYKQFVYDALFAFIEKVDNNPIVIISNSGQGTEWDAIENYHFAYLKQLLQNKGIATVSLKNLEQIDNYDGTVIVIVDLITNNDDLKNTCLKVFKKTRQRKAQIVYASLRKEYSESEASDIIKKEEKEKRDAEEKARRERELQERREREEAERRAREAREAEERRQREEAARKERQERNRLNTLAHTQKANAWEFRNYLTSNGIRYLYHFTDRRNLDSIRRNGGLYSWYYCLNHNIDIPYPGGGEQSRSLDRWHGLQDYVRLSFCDDHPMAYRLQQDGYNLVLLRIKIDVALLEDTQFSDINAADNAHHHGKTMEDLRRVDLSATQQHYVSSSSPIFKKHQAEVLVKTFIPLEYIENIDNPILM